MADSDKQIRKTIEDTISQFGAQARAMSQSVKEVQKFANALDEASNGAIDKATESIKKLLKSTGVLTDLQVDSIKTAKQANELLERLAIKQERLAELQAEYAAAIKAAGKAQDAKTEADLKLVKNLADLGIKVENVADAAEALKTNMDKLKDLNNGVREQTKFLNSASSKAGKAVEILGSKALASVEKFTTVSNALEMAGKAIEEVYNQAVRLSDRGMLMAMRAINVGAVKLRLSAEEFEKLIQENMNIVSALGGGVKGIDRFTEELKFAGTGLEYLGKNASVVGAKNMQALMRAGMGPGSRNGIEDVYRKNLVAMNKQFRLFQAGFGDTIEDFSAYYETVLQGDDVQQRMNSLDAKGIDLMMTEIRQRTENLRVMGLTTKQMEEMNKTLDAMYNPRKNNQTERMTQAIAFKNFYANTMQSATGDDQQVLMANQGLAEKYARAMQVGDSKTMQDLIGSKEGQQVAQALQRTRDRLMQKSIDTGQTYLPFMNNQWLDASGAGGQVMMNAGKTSLTVQNSGAHNQIGSPELAEWKDNVKKATGEGSELAKSFQNLRAAVEQVSSVLSNPFGTAVAAFVAGVLTMSETVRGALMNAIKGMISAVTGGGQGFVAGIRGIIGGLLKKSPILASIYAGLKGGWDGLNTSTDDYYTRTGIDKDATFVPQWMKDAGVRTLGVLSDVGAAAASGITFGAWDPSKNFADKQQKAAQPSATPAPASTPRASAVSATPLGNLIAKGESGAAGYNANNKGTKNNRIIAGDNLDLSQLTIGDIMKRQSLPPGDPNRLFAVGRYQMVPDTFKEAVNYLKLDPNTRFTPDVQEQMFQYLIMKKRPAIGNYISGKSNDLNGALLAASQEWASIADPRTGASYYGGANKASISTAQLSSVLQQMRAGDNGSTLDTAPVQAALANIPSDTNPVQPVNAADVAIRTGTPGVNQGNDAVSELKRQTELLAMIANNTVKTPLVDHAGYKKNQEAVIASA